MTQDEIKLQPHNMIDGVAVLLTQSQIAELNQPPSKEDLLNQLNSQKQAKINQCLAYLSSTDWQIIRLSDPTSGESLKEGVGENRALARSLQDDIKACTTLEELNAININFN
jgi:hypothetical protein